MKPERTKLEELCARIVTIAHPTRIVLFGSAARGEMRANSDFDVLVVMPDGTHRGRTAALIYKGLWGFGFAKDIVVATEGDLLKQAKNPYSVIHHAISEGRVLYDRVA